VYYNKLAISPALQFFVLFFEDEISPFFALPVRSIIFRFWHIGKLKLNVVPSPDFNEKGNLPEDKI
jgi:hypothetical protein